MLRFVVAFAVLASAIAAALASGGDPQRALRARAAPAAAAQRAREERVARRERALEAREKARREREAQRAAAYAGRHAIATLRAAVPISAYGGYVAWSAQLEGSERWALWIWHDGRAHRLGVPTREVPFDVDLGPDAAGRPTAVFSRCAEEPAIDPRPDWSGARGCRLHAVTMPDGADRALAGLGAPRGSQTTPTIWRGDIAFAEQLPGAVNPRIVLWRHATGTARVLPGGTPATHCRHQSQYCGSVVLQMDMSARILAFNWLFRGPGRDVEYGEGPVWELRAERLDSGRVVAKVGGLYSGTCGGEVPDSPAVGARSVAWLYWVDDCAGPGGDLSPHPLIVIDDFRRKHWMSAEPPPVRDTVGDLYAMARDGDTFYWLYGPHGGELSEQTAGGDPCPEHGCRLLRSSRLQFSRYG